MAQYVSGRQPFLNLGIPGITTNTTVLDITGRVGVGVTNPTADIDLNTIRIRQSLFDSTNSSGSLGYFLSKDAVGLKWVSVPPDNNNALFIAQNSVISGVSSYTGLNFISDGNDLVSISTNGTNSQFADIQIKSYWNKSGNTGIYTSKFVGIGSTSPTVALDVIGNSRISGIVTIGFGNTGVVINGTTGIVTSISGFTTVTFYGNLIGSASTTSFATTAFSIDATAATKLIVGYAQTAGIATYAHNAGIATYATNAGIATNLKGNVLYSIPYQSGTDTTSFLAPNSGLYLKSNGSGSAPSWDLPIGEINVTDTGNSSTYYPLFVLNPGNTGSVFINRNLFSFVPLSDNPRLGIGTGSPAYNLDVTGTGRFTGIVSASGATISGIVTIGVGNTGVLISSGIVTSSKPGVTTVTYYGNLIGSASTAGYATTAFDVDSTAASKLIVGYAQTAGIATSVIGGIASVTSLFVNETGISTLGNVKISSGIVTARTGIVTFYGEFIGTATTAGYATTAFNLDATAASNLSVAYAQTAGISTNVIGGIASVTSLFVNTTGISTLGTVKISSGIITATSGIVTYYGDGQYLDNVSGVRVEFQDLIGDPVYLTLANNTGVSSIGIIATGDNALVFIPSNGSLGIGTTNPTTKLDVNGDIRLRSGLYDYTNSIGIANSILVSTGSSVIWSSLSQLGGSDITIEVDESTPEPQYLVFTDATSGSTYTEKVSPTKLTYIASSGNLGIGTSIPSTPLSVEKYGVKTGFGTFVASAGITTDVDDFLVSDTNFKTAEYTVHIESSTSIQAQKVLVMQNGISAFSQEYGIMYDPTFMISIGATVSGGRCKLQFTPDSGISGLMTYRFTRETMK
jgi:hypothetical protein